MKKQNYLVTLPYQGSTIKIECSDSTALSRFLLHVRNALTESAMSNAKQGYNAIAASDIVLHDSVADACNYFRLLLNHK